MTVTLCPPLVHSGSLQHWYWCSVTRVCCWYCYHYRIVHNSFGWNSFQLLLQMDYLIENIASSEEKIYEQNSFISLQHLWIFYDASSQTCSNQEDMINNNLRFILNKMDLKYLHPSFENSMVDGLVPRRWNNLKQLNCQTYLQISPKQRTNCYLVSSAFI